MFLNERRLCKKNHAELIVSGKKTLNKPAAVIDKYI